MTKSTQTLIHRLRMNGVRLAVDSGQLVVDAPIGLLSDPVRDAIRREKARIVHYLDPSEPDPDDLHPISREDWEERAAIMEFDGGLTRPEAEGAAMDCVRRSRTRLAKS